MGSGGFGCVFRPALRCKNENTDSKSKSKSKSTTASPRSRGHISKLLTEDHAEQEFDNIQAVEERLRHIPHYKDYFLVYGSHLCSPATLSAGDLAGFDNKCTAMQRHNISSYNVNRRSSALRVLTMPDGGTSLEDLIPADADTFAHWLAYHVRLVDLWHQGVLPMNAANVFHGDIKAANMLVDGPKLRLIDWGLSVLDVDDDISSVDDVPSPWRERPFQYNVPHTVVLFTRLFVERAPDPDDLDATLRCMTDHVLERGDGHLKMINSMHFKVRVVLGHEDRDADLDAHFQQHTAPMLAHWLAHAAKHFNPRRDNPQWWVAFLRQTFMPMVDTWGILATYEPMFDALYTQGTHRDAAVALATMFHACFFTPRATPWPDTDVHLHLQRIGRAFQSA